MFDNPTLAILGTLTAQAAFGGWWLSSKFRNIEKLLVTHEKEDTRIFNEHGLRIQRLELHEFGFTAAGKEIHERA